MNEERELLDQTNQAPKRRHPDANSVLITGIASIFFFTIIGLLLTIVTFIKAGEVSKELNRHPSRYDKKSFRKVRIGKKCAITGIILKVVLILTLILLQESGVI